MFRTNAKLFVFVKCKFNWKLTRFKSKQTSFYDYKIRNKNIFLVLLVLYNTMGKMWKCKKKR